VGNISFACGALQKVRRGRIGRGACVARCTSAVTFEMQAPKDNAKKLQHGKMAHTGCAVHETDFCRGNRERNGTVQKEGEKVAMTASRGRGQMTKNRGRSVMQHPHTTPHHTTTRTNITTHPSNTNTYH